MKNRHLYILVFILCSVAFSVFAAKVLLLDLPLLPTEQRQTWEVEIRVRFTGGNAPAKITLYQPQYIGRYTIMDQGFISEGYGLSSTTEAASKKMVLTTRRARGDQTVYYRFITRDTGSYVTLVADRPAVEKPEWGEVEQVAGKAISTTARQESSDSLSFAASVIRQLAETPRSGNADILLDDEPSDADVVDMVVNVLSLAHIPARRVNGVDLTAENRSVSPKAWLEVYADGRWHAMTVNPNRPELPVSYLPWWRGTAPLVEIEGGWGLETSITVAPVVQPALDVSVKSAWGQDEPLLTVSFLGLPLDVQQVYRVLLTVPVGVLLLVLLRNVIGVATFGTFMPVLIALAFRETQLAWGIFLFSFVVGVALTARLYLEHLKLLVVPRLASVLIVVILAMAAMSLLSQKLGIDRGLSVALFPMVILTMTVERMSVVWDERGPAESLKHGLGSLIVASMCYFVMSLELIEHILFVFPELMLVLLSITLLLGRYTGYRLLELRRFKEIVKDAN